MKIYSVSEIAKLEGLSTAIVRRWAQKNNLNRLSGSSLSAFVFTEEDYKKFKNRRKKN